MMKPSPLVLAIAVAAVATGCATAERSRNLNDPAVAPATLAQQVCSNCHGLDGNSVSPNFPRLAGQTSAYLTAQLTEFRSHDRADPAGFEYMWGLSRHLTDAQIKGLAAYFSSQRPTVNAMASAPPAERVAAGREIFTKGVPGHNIPPCSTCHGPSAQGHDTFPRLAGQHEDYLVKQLTVFKKTNERPSGAVMKTVAHDLTADNIRAVAAYLQSLPPG
jgi:cytochrome c553